MKGAAAPPTQRKDMNMTAHATAVQPEIVTLPLERIRESSANPRQRFNDLDELAASIRTHGLLQPILVRPVRKDFELVVGARRLRAARLAGLTAIVTTSGLMLPKYGRKTVLPDKNSARLHTLPTRTGAPQTRAVRSTIALSP
jgi:hypothetical protein